MTALHLAAGLAVIAAAGHSYLSERLYLRPLRSEMAGATAFSSRSGKRLVSAMFHLASVTWVALAITLFVLDPRGEGSAATLHVHAAVYGLSGLGNFWAVGRVHPGGAILLSAAALVLVGLHA